MVAELTTIAVVVVAVIAELIHIARCRRLSPLVFGPTNRPRIWASFSPILRLAAIACLTWGLLTLLFLPPKIHKATELEEDQLKHVVLVLDVSPSMKLEDAGPTKDQQRSKRAADIMESFFQRVPMEQYRVSVIATYSGAKSVVIDTKDIEVVRNVLTDLPMHHAFQSGDTRLFDGLEEAFKVARPWNPKSTTLLLVSDGDTVPSTGMPKPPASIANVLVVGVGDPRTGKFISGRQSRQDTSTLRQIATRLRGIYHNGNEKHIATDTLNLLTKATGASPLEKLSRREFAIIACTIGATTLSLLPLLLHYVGTGWKPGKRSIAKAVRSSAELISS